MTWERVTAALFVAFGGAYFVMTCIVAPASQGASLIFGVPVGGVFLWGARELWKDQDA